MKKMMRTLGTLAMVILMLVAMAMPAMAAGFDFDSEISEFVSDELNTFELEVGAVHKPGAAVWAKNGQCYSSDETIVKVSDNGKVTAISEGTAYVAIVSSTNVSKVYRYDVVAVGEGRNDSPIQLPPAFNRTQNRMNAFMMAGIVIAVIIVSLSIAASVYIFVTAPKCGMSRAWALAPVVGNVIGLIAFIMVRTASKNTASGTNTVVCPTCNGVHPAGSQFCNICGTKLQ